MIQINKTELVNWNRFASSLQKFVHNNCCFPFLIKNNNSKRKMCKYCYLNVFKKSLCLVSIVWVDDDTVHVDDVNVEVGVRYFGLTAGAIASGFTEFGGGSNLSGWVSDFLLWSTAITLLLSPLEKKNNNFCFISV